MVVFWGWSFSWYSYTIYIFVDRNSNKRVVSFWCSFVEAFSVSSFLSIVTRMKWLYFEDLSQSLVGFFTIEYFCFFENLFVRSTEVNFCSESRKTVRFNQVSALQCPLYRGKFICICFQKTKSSDALVFTVRIVKGQTNKWAYLELKIRQQKSV